MADELKIPITTPGAREAKRALTEIADAEKKVGDHADQAGKKAAGGHKEAAGAADRLLGSLKGLVAGYVGLQGVLKVLAAIREEHERAVEVTRRHAEALREVLSLSSLQGERPQTIRAIQAMAVSAGRPVPEVAAAYNTLLGGTAGMDRGRQQGLMTEALAHGKAAPTASLESLVNLFATTATQAPKLSPRQISNLLSVTGEQAKGTVGEIASSLPNVLSAASAGGVGPEVAAATFSFATRAGGGVRRSGTAATAAILGLLAPQGETAKLLSRAGMPAGGLSGRLAWLAANADKLPPEAMTALGGREGIGAVAAIAHDPAGYQAEIAMMRNASAMPGSHIGGRLAGMYREVPAQMYLDQAKKMESRKEVLRYKPEVEIEQAIRDFHWNFRRMTGTGDAANWFATAVEDSSIGLGAGNIRGSEAMAAGEQLIREGYDSDEVLKAITSQIGPMGQIRGIAGSTGTVLDHFRGVARSRGIQPMQGATNIIHGSTVYINQDKAEPAGKPVAPAIRD